MAIVGFSFCMPFMRLYLRDELGVLDDIARARWAGVIAAAASIVMFFSAPLWGAISDRVGRKVMVMRAMFGGAVIVGLMGMATSPWHLFALRVAQGAVTGTVTASAALVSGVTPAPRIGFSMGMMQAAVFAGMAIGPLVGGTCIDQFGYRPTFFIAAAMLASGGVFVTVLAKEGPLNRQGRQGRQGRREQRGRSPWRSWRSRTSTSGSPVEPGEVSRPKQGLTRQGLMDVLRGPGFAVFVMVLFMMSFSRTMAAPVFQEYVEMLHGPPARGEAGVRRARDGLVLSLSKGEAGVNTWAGVLMCTRSVVAAVTSVGVGWLATRVSLAVLLGGGTVLAGLLAVPLACAGSLTQVLLLHVGLGLAAGTLGPALGRLVHSSVPRASHGKAYGLVQSANSAGFGLGPLTGGLLNAELMRAYGRETGLRLPYAFAGAFQVLAGLTCWLLLRSRVDGVLATEITEDTEHKTP